MNRKSKRTFCALALASLFCFPSIVSAGIEITEVAWMGTADDANNEWIELHETGGASIDITGWTLDDGGSLSIVLSGTLGAHAYAVLERTDDSTLPALSAFQIYVGALPNTGRTLTLKDETGTVQDTVAGGADWSSVGGNNETKETPQRSGGGWVTAIATPGAAALGESAPQQTVTTSSSQNQTPTVSSGSSGTKKKGGKSGALKEKPVYVGVLSLTITAPTVAYVHQPVTFRVNSDGLGPTILASLSHTWNFGDTYTGSGKEDTHTFMFPGTYTVSVFSKYGKQSAIEKHEIQILPQSLELSSAESGDVMVRNKGAHDIDLGGYTLRGSAEVVFPPYTFLGGGDAITILKSRVGDSSSRIVIENTMDASVATLVLRSGGESSPPPVPRQRQNLLATIGNVTEDQGESPPVPTVSATPSVIQIGNVSTRDTPDSSPSLFQKLWLGITRPFR